MVGLIKTIMIVDDEKNLLQKVKKYLEYEDVHVITATNNREALEQINAHDENHFDLILINTQIPGKKNKTALFPVKASTKEAIDDIDNYLQKPFTKEQFIEFFKTKIRRT